MSVSFPYLPVALQGVAPPTLPPGAKSRMRPLIRITVVNPQNGQSIIVDPILADTGADDTVLPFRVAFAIGLASGLTGLPAHQLQWAGRAWPMIFCDVHLEIEDGLTTYQWPVVAAFSTAPIRFPILGQASCFMFFDVTYEGAAETITFEVNSLFPGAVI
jgi:hypothetical protein